MDKIIIKDCKKVIEEGNLDYLQEMFSDIIKLNGLDWPFIFQKVYLHACLKGKEEIANWLKDFVFCLMDPIQQMACRQMFSYGKHLLDTHKSRQSRLNS